MQAGPADSSGRTPETVEAAAIPLATKAESAPALSPATSTSARLGAEAGRTASTTGSIRRGRARRDGTAAAPSTTEATKARGGTAPATPSPPATTPTPPSAAPEEARTATTAAASESQGAASPPARDAAAGVSEVSAGQRPHSAEKAAASTTPAAISARRACRPAKTAEAAAQTGGETRSQKSRIPKALRPADFVTKPPFAPPFRFGVEFGPSPQRYAAFAALRLPAVPAKRLILETG